MHRQYELIRLIVQKMEIHTEADDVDDISPNQNTADSHVITTDNPIGWSSNSLRHVMMKQAMVVSKWRKSQD